MARVEKSGSGYKVVHDTSGKLLGRRKSRSEATKLAKTIRRRNRTSTTRSRRAAAKHN